MRSIRIKALAICFGSLLLMASRAFAITYEITVPCTTETAVKGAYTLPYAPISIGAATLQILAIEGLPYIGSERGFNSILRTPVGDKTLEIISDSEMRSYGWCYEINGRVPDELASQYLLRGPEHIRWFYGVASYKNGEWVSFCKPTGLSTQRRYCH